MTKPITRINALLAKAGRTERLVRNTAGGGYYYVADCASSSSLHVYRLDDTPGDHQLAQALVEEVLSAEDGKPFTLTPPAHNHMEDLPAKRGLPLAEFFGLTPADDGATPAKVEDIKKGEFVKRKADAKKVYKRGSYDASSKRYSLLDVEDISSEIFVKRGTTLFIGFTY
jgi:hypothetical protein